jgi:putative SOS response-associated peptidase YedK
MPGRYAVTSPPSLMRKLFGYVEEPDFPPRYNIAPTQPVPIVHGERDAAGKAARHFTLMRWGFIPAFVKDPRSAAPIINPRSETAAERTSFRAALMRRRCIFIADAFYQWQAQTKRVFLVRRPDASPFGMAGIWECWTSPYGDEIDTACMLTTSANGTLAAIAERMPVILERKALAAWLDTGEAGLGEAMRLARPAPDDALVLVEIGDAVNRVANDGPFVQEPLKSANGE